MLQNELDFDMLPYLGGVKGPAQCIKFASKPMKIHVLPRSGRDHKVCLIPWVLVRKPALFLQSSAACILFLDALFSHGWHKLGGTFSSGDVLHMDHSWFVMTGNLNLCPYMSYSVAFMLNATFLSTQVFQTESTFLIHHANAFEDGEEIEVTIVNLINQSISKCIHHFLT